MRNRLIVWYDQNNKILGAFGTPEEAAEKTGIKKSEIERCLIGTLSRTKNNWHFGYEVLASDYRRKKDDRH